MNRPQITSVTNPTILSLILSMIIDLIITLFLVNDLMKFARNTDKIKKITDLLAHSTFKQQ